MSVQSPQELQTNLDEYQGQLEQVDELLTLDPGNSEYQDLHGSLLEVIQLTEDLLRDAQQQQPDAPAPKTRLSRFDRDEAVPKGATAVSAPSTSAVVTAPSLQLPSILPPQVAEQIRSAQQRAALQNQAPASWAIGARCQAVFSGDGEWYNASVSGVTAGDNFLITFAEYGNQEEVHRSSVRPRPDGSEVYRGVSAPKRKAVNDAPQLEEMPKYMEITDKDDEKSKAKKRKLQKSWKSNQRFAKKDAETQKRQQSWMDFKKGKGSKHKAGFLSTGKKGSMFSVPDDPSAKVGVVGSGQGMTDYKKVARHDFNPDAE
ncbi:hypothetical protein ABBQ32_005477 [Trebouxia sp. C0010 RCD-2024]